MTTNKPQMGFNTWNTFGNDVSDELLISLVDEIIKKGLDKVGFKYLVVDDGWQALRRDKDGNLMADPVKFKNGIEPVIEYAHSKGLKFGIYSCAGVKTCGGHPGSYGYEQKDANYFAKIGCDYLKYDYCYTPNLAEGSGLYRKMGMALRNSGREILFSACNWGLDGVEDWARSCGANSYRSTFDIFDNFKSFIDIFNSQLDRLKLSGPSCFNDMDMLTVGMFGNGYVGKGGCNFEEYKTQYGLWCMCGVPLILGADIRKMSEECLDLIKNEYLIRINQDEECRPPYVIGSGVNNELERNVLFRFLSNNEYALMVYNTDEIEREFLVSFAQTGMTDSMDFEMFDVFEKKPYGVYRDYLEVKVAPHGSKIFIVRPKK